MRPGSVIAPMTSNELVPRGERCNGLIEAYTTFGSITRALREVGISDYRRKETLVPAAIVDAVDAEYLMQSRTRPVLVAESINVDLEGRPVHFPRSRFASDRVQLSVRVKPV
jgi:GntR family phosphonate transport system transcriptional regulator